MADVEYKTREGDVLDDILYRYYGRGVPLLSFIFAANPGLCELGEVYKAGVKIILPPMPSSTKVQPTYRPWGRTA